MISNKNLLSQFVYFMYIRVPVSNGYNLTLTLQRMKYSNNTHNLFYYKYFVNLIDCVTSDIFIIIIIIKMI